MTMAKDGDKLVEYWRRRHISNYLLALVYVPDWLYWVEYAKVNRN
jgi:uncharacterized protein YhfF